MKYQLIESKGAFFDEHWCVEITEDGPYKGLIYQYDTVKLQETAEGDVEFHFSTVFVNNPNDVSDTDQELIEAFGQILVELIEEYMKEQDDKNGTADSQEPDPR
jgi:hypothetical protein